LENEMTPTERNRNGRCKFLFGLPIGPFGECDDADDEIEPTMPTDSRANRLMSGIAGDRD
jgi:hypothetical protein